MQFDEFATFEKNGGEHVVQSYEDYFGRLTVQSHPALLDALHVIPGTCMLDVAAGPGYLAAAAIERGATAAAVDFSASMIAHARHLHPEVEFQIASAEHLPFDAEASMPSVSASACCIFPNRSARSRKPRAYCAVADASHSRSGRRRSAQSASAW